MHWFRHVRATTLAVLMSIAATAAMAGGPVPAPPLDPSNAVPQIQGLSPANLQHIHRCFDGVRAGNRECNIAIAGDSTSCGDGSGSGNNGYTGARALTYATRLAQILNKALPAYQSSFFGDCWVQQSGGGATTAYGAYDARVVEGAGWSTAGYGVSVSMGGYNFANNTTTNSLSFTPTNQVNTFKVAYLIYPSFGTLNVNIDGSAPATGGSSIVEGSNVDTQVHYATFTASAVGSHTINLSPATAGSGVTVLGVDAWNSTIPSVHIHLMSLNGGTSGQVLQSNVSQNYYPAQALVTFRPDVIIYNLCINNYIQNLGPAGCVSDIQNSITLSRANASVAPDCIIVTPWPSAVVASVTPRAQYDAALRTLATVNGCVLIDLAARRIDFATLQALGFSFDNYHPLSNGYWDEAALIASFFLSPPAGSGAIGSVQYDRVHTDPVARQKPERAA